MPPTTPPTIAPVLLFFCSDGDNAGAAVAVERPVTVWVMITPETVRVFTSVIGVGLNVMDGEEEEEVVIMVVGAAEDGLLD